MSSYCANIRWRHILSILVIFLLWLGYYCSHSLKKEESLSIAHSSNVSPTNPTNFSIQIVVVIGNDTKDNYYKHALDSLRCYSQIQNYSFHLAVDTDFSIQCPHKDKFFRRHCVTANLLHLADFTLFIDADIGVVNPKRRIEEFIDDRFDITFYDRFYNQEVMAGAYLVRNTEWSRTFLRGWADFENRLPNSFHGTDNGAIHAYLALTIFPRREKEYTKCFQLYKISQNFDDLFSFEACIRAVMGISEEFGRVRILKKGTGWARDNWLTNSKWNPDRDFMIHGWKANQLVTYRKEQLPLTMQERSRGEWFNPLSGSLALSRCSPRNSTWSYDRNLITTVEAIQTKLDTFFEQTENARYKFLSLISRRLNL